MRISPSLRDVSVSFFATKKRLEINITDRGEKRALVIKLTKFVDNR